jgi:hypothetical protein
MMAKAMTTYDFTVVLSGADELTVELADRLYAAGCDDGTPHQRSGIVQIGFGREASDLESAIRSAIANVVAAGCVVARVQIEADAPLLRS